MSKTVGTSIIVVVTALHSGADKRYMCSTMFRGCQEGVDIRGAFKIEIKDLTNNCLVKS